MRFFKHKKALFAILSAAVFSFEIYTAVPNNITVIDGNDFHIPYVESTLSSGKNNLKLFGIIPYKTVEVNVIPAQKLILSGETVGIKLCVDGALVLGLADIKTPEGEKVCPAAQAGITTGDLIKSVNGTQIDSVETLEAAVCGSEACCIIYERNGTAISATVTPAVSYEDNTKKLGVWVRGGATGIGTMTYISPEDGSFGALGHPISDADTGDIIKSSDGSLLDAKIVGVVKGERGLPGEIQGTVEHEGNTGKIKTNTSNGVFGSINTIPLKDTVEIATKNETQLGEAFVVTDVAGGQPLPYRAEIVYISHNAESNKSMVIKITDENLLSITGGIVQGMSGSPIIQNGRIVGAVTHVFVNDPTRGYGIFIENMLAEAEKNK